MHFLIISFGFDARELKMGKKVIQFTTISASVVCAVGFSKPTQNISSGNVKSN
jgi:hypothetical protein